MAAIQGTYYNQPYVISIIGMWSNNTAMRGDQIKKLKYWMVVKDPNIYIF